MSFTGSTAGISSLAVKQARDAWITAVEARDIDAVVALYDPDGGRLLGTLDDAQTPPRSNHARIRDYFEMFLANDAVEARFPAQVFEKDVQRMGPDHIAYHGYYSFRLEKDGQARIAHAKFTYLYRRTEDDRLLILAHNSGLTPHGIVLED